MYYYIFALIVSSIWLFISIRSNYWPAICFFALIFLGIICSWIFKIIDEDRAKRFFAEQQIKKQNKIIEDFNRLNLKFFSVDNKILAFESPVDVMFYCKEQQCGMVILKKSYKTDNRTLYFPVTKPVAKNDDAKIIIDYLMQTYIDQNYQQLYSVVSVQEESEQSKKYLIELAKQEEEKHQKIKRELLSNIEVRQKSDIGKSAVCVYVVCSKTAAKIGISDKPNTRLKQLQTGNSQKLSLAKVWWFFGRDDAVLIESYTHNLLRVKGHHALGEWFNCNKAKAVSYVTQVIDNLLSEGKIDKAINRLSKLPEDAEYQLSKLLKYKWKISMKGNEYFKIEDALMVVFKKRGAWWYSFNGDFSKISYPRSIDAKAAVLQKFNNIINVNGIET